MRLGMLRRCQVKRDFERIGKEGHGGVRPVLARQGMGAYGANEMLRRGEAC